MKKLFSKRNGKRLLQAVITSYIIYGIIGYILNGEVYHPLDLLSVEFIFVALYMSATFLVLTYISSYFNKKSYQFKQKFFVRFLELVLVVIVGIALNFLLFIIPVEIFYGEEVMVKQPDGRTRLIYALHLIIALVYYYFVERINTQTQLKNSQLQSERLKKENTEAQLMALKNQINPHFLFNSFNILNSLIDLDPAKAQVFLEQLSNIYRVFLENINKTLITLEEEMEVMESYKSLLETRFQNHLDIKINIDDQYKQHFLPPGVSQMLIENAIKHNGFNKRQPLLIEVTTSENFLTVKNNRQSRTTPSSSTGIGLQNIKARYQLQGNSSVIILKDEQHFIVKVPLLNQKQNEVSDH